MEESQIKKGEQCPFCKKYNARQVVTNSLVIEKNKILLIKRNIEPCIGMWALPGGYIDWDETIENSAIREAKEETGVDCVVSCLLGVYSDPKRDPFNIQNVCVAFVLKPENDVINYQKEEVSDAKWFELENLPELAFDHGKIIEDYKNKKTSCCQ